MPDGTGAMLGCGRYDMAFDVRVSYSGPLFDGRAAEAAEAFCRAAEQEVAEEGTRFVHTLLAGSLRHPTGRYQSGIHAEKAGVGWAVRDSMIVYGPWLEGVGSRNSPVTRFPGYFSFRRATAPLQAASVMIAERVLQRFLPRMQ